MYFKSQIVPKHNKPTELYQVVADITARDAIPSNVRFEGRECIVLSNNNKYRLIGGITNTNWVIVSGGSAPTIVDEEFVVDATIQSNGYIDLLNNPNGAKGQVFVFYDGIVNYEGAGNDYTMPNPDRVNFTYSLRIGALIKIKYSY